uniref:Uncharacterized protein n=1 Tax=Odontella aurita TaxID=265563 RepID=A0A7S4JFU1_9STRA
MRAAAGRYPLLAGLTGGIASLTGGVAPSFSDDNDNDDDEGRLTLLSKTQPATLQTTYYSTSSSSPSSSNSTSTSTSTSNVVVARSNRRRIHPRKPRHVRPDSVSFSELVSVKEIRRYEHSDARDCFYTPDELRSFRREYLSAVLSRDDASLESGTRRIDTVCDGDDDDDDDAFDALEELVDAVWGCVRGAVYAGPRGFCRMMGVPVP